MFMKLIKSFILIILCLFAITPVFAANASKKSAKPFNPVVHKTYDVETKDGFVIKAYVSYPKTRMNKYPVVILLHSLGENYTSFAGLENKLNYAGFATVGMDLRGHGKSVYTKTLRQRAWQYFKNDTYALYPSDVLYVMQYVKAKHKRFDFSDYAIIGSDIGANTGILVARVLPVKPKALVLFSPMMSIKGLYIPVAMTEIGLAPILAIASSTDALSISQQSKLAKFAQGNFDALNMPKGGMGMTLLKGYPELEYQITYWLKAYFKGRLTPITPASLAAAKAKAAAAKAAKAAKLKAEREAKLKKAGKSATKK